MEQEKAIRDRFAKDGELGIRLVLPDREYVRFPSGGKLFQRTIGESGLHTVPLFDYRLLGWATLDLSDEEIRVDTKRDYWLVSRTHWTATKAAAKELGRKRTVNKSAKIELEKFEDQWLPKRVELMEDNKSSQSSVGYDFKWKSFNKTIDPDIMTPEYARRRLIEYEEAKQKEKAKAEAIKK